MGYILGSKFQHKGYAQEALTKIMEYLFYDRDLYMIKAKVNETNIASIRLLKKLGFRQDAVLRKRRIDLMTGERNDLYIFSILKDEFCSDSLAIKG